MRGKRRGGSDLLCPCSQPNVTLIGRSRKATKRSNNCLARTSTIDLEEVSLIFHDPQRIYDSSTPPLKNVWNTDSRVRPSRSHEAKLHPSPRIAGCASPLSENGAKKLVFASSMVQAKCANQQEQKSTLVPSDLTFLTEAARLGMEETAASPKKGVETACC